MATKVKAPAVPPIETLYIALGIGPDGDEGIMATFDAATNCMIPLVASTRGGIVKLKGQAREIAAKSGGVIRVVAFSRGRVVGEFQP